MKLYRLENGEFLLDSRWNGNATYFNKEFLAIVEKVKYLDTDYFRVSNSKDVRRWLLRVLPIFGNVLYRYIDLLDLLETDNNLFLHA